MKKIKLLFYTAAILLLSIQFAVAQGNTCGSATPFCLTPGQSFVYPNIHNGSVAQSGPNYGCLSEVPDPSWFYIKTTAAGTLTYTLSQNSAANGSGTGIDVDYICYGPFTAASFANACNNLTAGNTQSCSYSAASIEHLSITATAAGQYYIILITNYSGYSGLDANGNSCASTGCPGYVNITAGASNNPTDCSITCNPTTISMLAQDTTNYGLANTTYMANGATAKCGLPFFVWPPESSSLTDPNTDILTPCIMLDFNPFKTNLNTKGNITVYEGGSPIFNFCNTCTDGTIGGGVATAGNDYNLYLSYLDSTVNHVVSYCNTGTVGTTTVTLKNCWDGTILAGPQTWNATTASCFSLTVAANSVIGSAVYSISPAAGMSGVYDSHYGYAYVNPDLMASGTYTLTYTFHGRNGCAPGIGTYVFTVPVKPTIAITPTSTTVCGGASVALTASGGNTYTWTPSSGGGLSGTTGANVTAAPTISPASYTVVGTNTATGCKNTAVATVTITATPTITITGTKVICNGGNTVLTGGTASNYTWMPGNITTNTISVNPTGNTTYTLTGANGTCTASAVATVTVNPLPTLTLTSSSASVCSSTSTTLTASGANTYTWSSSAGGGLSGTSGTSVTAMPTVSPATYTVTGTNTATGCVGTPATTTITIVSTPTITASQSTYTTCLNAPVIFSVSGGTSYTWTPTTNLSGVNSATPTVTPSSTATVVYSVTGASSGCTSSATTVTLNVSPLPTYSLSANSYTICNGNSQGLIVSGASTYTWTPSATLTGANTSNPTASPTSTTVYSVTGTSAVGCGNLTPATVTVTVNPKPAYSLVGNAYTICSGGSQTFTVSGASTYTWTPSATLTGANTANPTASPTTTTVYSVTGTSAAGCGNLTPATVTVTVSPVPSLSLTANSYTICNGGSQTFTVSGGSTYSWTPAGTLTGASTANPVASPSTTTIYTVAGTASGCAPSSPLTLTLTINPLPTYSLAANSYTICNGSSKTFTVSGASTYTWTPSATLTGANTANPTASPTTTTVYSVTGTSTAGCGNVTPATVTLTVNPTPTYSLASNTYSICSGASQTFSVSGASTYTWTPSATLTGANTATPTATPTATTVYSVTGTSNSGCGNLTPATVTVNVTPTPTLSITGIKVICSGGSTVLTGATATNYTWMPGTVNTNTISVNPTANTTYTLTGANGSCTTSAVATVTVNPLPTITVVPSSTAICSGGGSSTLTASGAGSTGTYTWTPSATLSTSTGSVVTATPTNTIIPTVYTVTGTDANSCVNNTIVSITVNQTPTITVTGGGGNAQTVCAGGLVNTTVNGITFSVTPAGSVNWTNSNAAIGLGTTGTGNIASYPAPSTLTVQAVGTITATAIASGSGCPSTSSTQLIYTITINPIPGAATPTITPASCGVNDGTIIGADGTGGSTYQYSWNGGPFTSASSYTNGAGTYPLEIKDIATGCIFSKNFTLPNAGAPPPPTVTASSPAICVGGTATLTVNAPVAGTTYSWTPAVGTAGIGNTFTVTVPAGAPNPFTIDVTSTASNCTGVAGTTSITVNQLPTPSISNSTSQICNLSSTTLTVTPNSGGYSYQWGNASGAIAGAIKDTLTVSAGGVYSVTVTNTATGCQATTSANGTITVNSLPVIDTTGVNVTQSNCTTPTGAITNVTYTVNGTGVYVWTDNSTGNVVGGNTPTLSNVPAGNYCVQVTDANLCVTKFCSISVLNAGAPSQPVLTASLQDTIYCDGTGPKTLTVTVANSGTVTPTVNWYDGSNNVLISNSNTYTPTDLPVGTTTLYVSATASGCSSITKPVTVTVLQTPAAPTLSGSVSNPLIECQGVAPATVSLTTTSSVTPIWYVGTTTVNVGQTLTPSTATPTTTIYVISDSSTVTGCTSASIGNVLTVTVTINPAPAPPTLSGTVSNPLVECQGVTPATLSVTTTASTTPVWYAGTGTVNVGPTYTPSTATPTTTVYTISDSSTVTGCTNIDAGNALTVTVTINPAPAPPTLSGTVSNPLVECQGVTPVTLSVTTTASTTPVWYAGTGTVNVGPTYTPSTATPTTTVYTISDSSTVTGCTNLDAGNALTVTVTISPAPSAPVLSGSAANPLVECQGTSAGSINVTPTGTVASVPVWYNGTTYVTSGNSYTPSTNVAGTTVYTISDSASVTNGCSSASAGGIITVTVTINPTPIVDVSTAVTATAQCGQPTGGVSGITNVSSGTPGYQYQWIDATGSVVSNSLTLSGVQAGSYTLVVTDSKGCVANSSLTGAIPTFSVPTSAALVATFSTTPSPAIGSIPLNVVFTNQSNVPSGSHYVWSFGDGMGDTTVNTTHTYTAVGTYTASLFIQNGLCTSNIAVALIVAEIPTTITVPNVFSPNGDNINDEFFIINTGMTSLNCQIFSRWGQLLHTLTAPDQRWDGMTPNGDKAPEGTYMYILQAEGLDGKTYKQQGTLMLVR